MSKAEEQSTVIEETVKLNAVESRVNQLLSNLYITAELDSFRLRGEGVEVSGQLILRTGKQPRLTVKYWHGPNDWRLIWAPVSLNLMCDCVGCDSILQTVSSDRSFFELTSLSVDQYERFRFSVHFRKASAEL